MKLLRTYPKSGLKRFGTTDEHRYSLIFTDSDRTFRIGSNTISMKEALHIATPLTPLIKGGTRTIFVAQI